jgi:transcriptional regulator of acetoin/glycerol metabolism
VLWWNCLAGKGRLTQRSTDVRPEVYDLIARVAPTDVTVLLTGESGTGKELVAQTLHMLSRRRKGPFLPLNCGAISPNLIELEPPSPRSSSASSSLRFTTIDRVRTRRPGR